MFGRRRIACVVGVLGAVIALRPFCFAAAKKQHLVGLGATKKVAYSKAGDPAGAQPGEDSLKLRPLIVDGVIKEWTTGDSHDVTDRSFVVRRAIRLNDESPGEKPPAGPSTPHWVWQRGPWVLVDRVTGHFTALKLPDYDPAVSQVIWFRDYAAYCGVTASGKSLYAVVSELAVRKPVVARKLGKFDPDDTKGQREPVCEATEWQREPLRVVFHPVGREPASFGLVPGSAVLVEDSADEPAATAPVAKPEN